MSSFVLPGPDQQFQHILRLLNTNVDGRRKITVALTEIKGIGRRYADIVLKKADIDRNKRAGQLNPDELERIVNIVSNPTTFKIPEYMLNRQRDRTTGKNEQLLSNNVDARIREDVGLLAKMRNHRGLRHAQRLVSSNDPEILIFLGRHFYTMLIRKFAVSIQTPLADSEDLLYYRRYEACMCEGERRNGLHWGLKLSGLEVLSDAFRRRVRHLGYTTAV